MYITQKKFEEIKNKYSSLLVVDGDVADAFLFVQDVLEAETDAIKEREPHATVSIERLNRAAYEVFNVQAEVENKDFMEAEDIEEEDVGADDIEVEETVEDVIQDAAMTDKEYFALCIEESKSALMALLAKVEHPIGDALSDILEQAVSQVEELQEQAYEHGDVYEDAEDYEEEDGLEEKCGDVDELVADATHESESMSKGARNVNEKLLA